MWLGSGGRLVFGIAMLVLGVDAVAVPGYLVFNNIEIVGGGLALGAVGVIFAYHKARLKKQ